MRSLEGLRYVLLVVSHMVNLMVILGKNPLGGVIVAYSRAKRASSSVISDGGADRCGMIG